MVMAVVQNVFCERINMNRQWICDSNSWFDETKATKYLEDTYWNGRNKISVNTGSQWDHQWLYRTEGGKWVLNSWSNYQGSPETFVLISEEEAALWLAKNNEEIPPELLHYVTATSL
jgi:hypothetical protein